MNYFKMATACYLLGASAASCPFKKGKNIVLSIWQRAVLFRLLYFKTNSIQIPDFRLSKWAITTKPVVIYYSL